MNCAYCHSPILDEAFTCPECQTDLHFDCARDAGACPAVGCGAGPGTSNSRPPALPPGPTTGEADLASAPSVPSPETYAPAPPIGHPLLRELEGLGVNPTHANSRPKTPGHMAWTEPVGPPTPVAAPAWVTPAPATSKKRPAVIAVGVVLLVLVMAGMAAGPSGPLQSPDERRANAMADVACDEIRYANRLEASFILAAGLDVATDAGIEDLFIDALWAACPTTMTWVTS